MQHYVIKFASGRWFSPGTPVSSANKTDHQDIAEILLKVALNTINKPNLYIYIPNMLISKLRSPLDSFFNKNNDYG
jgi:hypothetical protein